MAIEKPAWLSAKTVSFVFALFWALTDILVDVVTGATSLAKTGNSKMLIDATVGKLFTADLAIKNSVDQLLSSGAGLGHEYVVFLKQAIIKDLFLILIAILLVYWILKHGVFRFVISKEQTNYGIALIVWIFAIGITLIIMVAYNSLVHDVMQAPFSGVIYLIRNLNIFSITGV